MASHCIGGVDVQGRLSVSHGVIQLSRLMMCEGVFSQESPIVHTVGRDSPQQSQVFGWEIRSTGAAAPQHVQAVRQPHQQPVGGELGQMFFDQGYGSATLAVDPMVHSLDLLLLTSGNPGSQLQGTVHGLPGLVGPSFLLLEIGQARVGHSEPFIQLDGLLEFQLRTMVLRQKPVHAFLPSFRSDH